MGGGGSVGREASVGIMWVGDIRECEAACGLFEERKRSSSACGVRTSLPSFRPLDYSVTRSHVSRPLVRTTRAWLVVRVTSEVELDECSPHAYLDSSVARSAGAQIFSTERCGNLV
eukprot:9485937-Pyramimonas_sp.AAC.1